MSTHFNSGKSSEQLTGGRAGERCEEQPSTDMRKEMRSCRVTVAGEEQLVQTMKEMGGLALPRGDSGSDSPV